MRRTIKKSRTVAGVLKSKMPSCASGASSVATSSSCAVSAIGGSKLEMGPPFNPLELLVLVSDAPNGRSYSNSSGPVRRFLPEESPLARVAGSRTGPAFLSFPCFRREVNILHFLGSRRCNSEDAGKCFSQAGHSQMTVLTSG